MIDLSPEVLSTVGTVAGGAAVGGGYAIWKRLSKLLEAGKETQQGVNDLKNGVMQKKVRDEVDAALTPVKSDITELKESHKHMTSRLDALYTALIPHGQQGND